MFFTHISHQTSSLNLVFFPHRQNRPQLAPLISKLAFSGPPDVPLYVPTDVSALAYLHPRWTVLICQFHNRLHGHFSWVRCIWAATGWWHIKSSVQSGSSIWGSFHFCFSLSICLFILHEFSLHLGHHCSLLLSKMCSFLFYSWPFQMLPLCIFLFLLTFCLETALLFFLFIKFGQTCSFHLFPALFYFCCLLQGMFFSLAHAPSFYLHSSVWSVSFSPPPPPACPVLHSVSVFGGLLEFSKLSALSLHASLFFPQPLPHLLLPLLSSFLLFLNMAFHLFFLLFLCFF